MEKKTAGLVGALAGLASMGTAQAAIHTPQTPAHVLQVSSYADLLKPIPNATALLKLSNAELLQNAPGQPKAEDVQYYDNEPPPPVYHHHHHHHHAYYPPPPVYHHHHHHHHGVTVLVPGIGVIHSN